MRDTQNIATNASRLRWLALVVGLVAAVAAVAGIFLGASDAFFQSYLFSFVFWTGLSLGLLALLMLHFVVGSRWGLTIRRIAEAGASTLWLMALLFIPLLLGLPRLYLWARPEAVAASPLLQYKSAFLNVPSFIVRGVVYFVIWIGLMLIVNRLSARLAASGEMTLGRRLQGWGAFGLILYALSMTFAAVDWLMSLQPAWTSSVYGMILVISQVLAAMAFAIVVLNLIPQLSVGNLRTYRDTPTPYGDLGALLMTLVMGWGYLAFFQLLIIWAGNLPREVTWYVDRTAGNWIYVGIFLALFQLGLPFMALLTVRIRHNIRLLGLLGALILLTSLVNMYWQVIPVFSPGALAFHWLNLVVPLAMGGLWLAVFLFFLPRRPALAELEQAALLEGAPRQEESGTVR